MSPGRVAPVGVHKGMDQRLTRICYQAYAVAFSGVSGTPIWAAELLTRNSVRAARKLPRKDAFFQDGNVPVADRSSLASYEGSGLDRGHLAPSGDMPTMAAQRESFSLANMIPQEPDMNRYLWSEVESVVRDLAARYDAVHVVTGPMFEEEELATLDGRVLVPTSVFKAVYIPGRGAAAYVAPNLPQARVRVVPVARLRERAGLDVFPGLPAKFRNTAIALPVVTARKRGSHARRIATLSRRAVDLRGTLADRERP